MRNSMTRWILAAVLVALAALGVLAHVINLLTIQTFGEEKQMRKSMLRSLVSLMFLLMLSAAAHATAAITLTS